MNSVKQIIESANSTKKKKYNILTFPTHERYESELCKTGHNFYSFSLNNHKSWNKEQVEVPENYYIMPKDKIISWIDYDFMLVQSKFWQYQVAQQIMQQLPMKLIVLEHTLPTPETIPASSIEQMKHMVGDINVFISDFSRQKWCISKNTKVIHHGVDSETFKPLGIAKEKHVLTVANDFINRDYCLNFKGWKRVTESLPVKLIGDTSGLSEPCKSIDELVNAYNSCSVYFNSSTLSPIPTSLLEAMSCGCAIVSTATCMIPDIIQNGENGYISNNESELKEYLDKILKDNELREYLGNNARKTVQKIFSEQEFINNWNQTFDEIYEATQK